ncbi:MAG: monofunctional biosynthetic peptidoglycan transglycosylase [Candidatus Binatia bacterium]
MMKRLLVKSVFLSLVMSLAAFGYSRLPDVSVLKKNNPRTTALITLRQKEYRQNGSKSRRRQTWVSYAAISDHLKQAVIISEDASFFSHNGIDLFEIKESLKEDWEEGAFKRGGSTITMQLAKNLYLTPAKNPLRKLKEVVIALQLESALSKKRIFELYLNVVEWGRGIYGVEAASRFYFAKPSTRLTAAEAAFLAALLPNPINPRRRSLRHRRDLILGRMLKAGYISAHAFRQGIKAPLWLK